MINIYDTGYKFISGAFLLFVLGVGMFFMFKLSSGVVLAGLGILTMLFFCYFFRDPDINCEYNEGAIVSAATGVVMQVNKGVKLPKFLIDEFETWDSDSVITHVKVFMSPLDVHVNRNMVSGTVEKIFYKEGTFKHAGLEGEDGNESNYMLINLGDDRRIILRQKAGRLARRIICRLKEGDEITIGDRFGIIQFSSGVDCYLPEDFIKVDVKVGDRLNSGETVMGSIIA